MLNRPKDRSLQQSLGTLSSLPSSYPEGTPGRLFFDLSPKEVLVLVRGAREAAQEFRTTLQGLLLGLEADPAAFHDILPMLISVIRDNLDYEVYPAVELTEQAAILYADPKNANLRILEVLTLAMKNLKEGGRDNPQGVPLNKAKDN